MLSELHQKLVLKMWIRHNYDNEGLIQREDLQTLYKSRSSFYNGISYLIDAGIVERVELKTNCIVYRLTIRGGLLAKVLCGLPDVPRQFHGDKSLLDLFLRWKI